MPVNTVRIRRIAFVFAIAIVALSFPVEYFLNQLSTRDYEDFLKGFPYDETILQSFIYSGGDRDYSAENVKIVDDDIAIHIEQMCRTLEMKSGKQKKIYSYELHLTFTNRKARHTISLFKDSGEQTFFGFLDKTINIQGVDTNGFMESLAKRYVPTLPKS